MSGVLPLWVVFDHPRDFPAHVVVREQRAGGGLITHAPVACLYASMQEAHHDYRRRGLTWLERQPDDDPCIVGVWV